MLCARSRNASPDIELSEQIQKGWRASQRRPEVRTNLLLGAAAVGVLITGAIAQTSSNIERIKDPAGQQNTARDSRVEKERAHGLSEYAERRAGCTAEQGRAGRGRCEQAAARRCDAAAECAAAFQFGTRTRSATGASSAAECAGASARRAHRLPSLRARRRLPRNSRRRRDGAQRRAVRPRPQSRRVRAAAA